MSAPALPALAALARHASELRFTTIPETVRRQAVLTILDTVGCMAGGSRTAEAAALIAGESLDIEGGSVSVVGHAKRFGPRAAARINGYMGDIHELNDLTCGHAGIGNVSAVLAIAELLRSTGREVIEALTVGIETTCRVYSTYYSTMKAYDDVAIVPVGPVDSVGAAAAVARLMKLNEAQLLNAMAIGMAQASWCPAEVIFGEGGSIKPMLFGALPAACGIQAASYASAGITGPHNIIESPMGFLRTVAKTSTLEPMYNTSQWYLAEARRKYHACCGYIHSAADSLIALRRDGIEADSVERIEIQIPSYIVPAVSKSTPPRTSNEARFHLQYILALALCSEDIILPAHSDDFGRFLRRPDVARMIGTIDVVEDKSLRHYHQSKVTLFGNTAEVIAERTNDKPKGSPRNPLTEIEIREKFKRLTRPLADHVDLDGYVAKVLRLESAAECGWIVRELAF